MHTAHRQHTCACTRAHIHTLSHRSGCAVTLNHRHEGGKFINSNLFFLKYQTAPQVFSPLLPQLCCSAADYLLKSCPGRSELMNMHEIKAGLLNMKTICVTNPKIISLCHEMMCPFFLHMFFSLSTFSSFRFVIHSYPQNSRDH